ncbi:PQQ-binding-like beta-propeller repeat protein, partial [Streptomyces sp. SID5785]|uniref:outer membrane protein assembly factor BamB family protein n=1 Tax=Streptomyces sp. SID5785 TaxID=2690309 RepID=UPI0013611A11
VADLPSGVVADGKILGSDGKGHVVARAADDGRLLWSQAHGLKLREDARDTRMAELMSAAAVDLTHRVAYFLAPSGHLVGLDLDSGAVRWRGQVTLPRGPVQGGIAPELMRVGDGLVGQVGGELFRIEPKLG